MRLFARLAILIFALVTLDASANAAELFANGDFEAGVAVFTTDYSFNGLDNTLPGQFSVESSPFNVHPSWGVFDDHTLGDGSLMMTANGSTSTGMAIWRQTVAVVPGTDYTFSAWGASNFSSNPATLSFRANDVEFATLLLPFAVGVWTNSTTVINAGLSTSIEFEIVDNSVLGFGNDLSLDDISLDGQIPVTESADFDEDGDVDGQDFLIWQRGFGAGTTLGEGDANGSMSVDETDLEVWQVQYGVGPMVAFVAIPEPSPVILLIGTIAIVFSSSRLHHLRML